MATKGRQTERPTDAEEDITPGAMSGVAPDEPATDSPEGTEYVEYIGKATTRRITESEWAQAGVKNQDTVEWSISNGMKLSTDNFSQDALKVLRKDGSFRVPADR